MLSCLSHKNNVAPQLHSTQPQTKSRAITGIQNLGRTEGGKKRRKTPNEQQTDRCPTPPLGHHSSLMGTSPPSCAKPRCSGKGGVPPYLEIERSQRGSMRERRKEGEKKERLHNSHFLSSTLKVMFYLTGSSLRGEK